MGRVWLGAPQSAAAGTTARRESAVPRPFDLRDAAAIARLAAPLRAQPAQQHGQRDGAGRRRPWWRRLFQR